MTFVNMTKGFQVLLFLSLFFVHEDIVQMMIVKKKSDERDVNRPT